MLMVPVNFPINSMDGISSLCHCIAKNINIHVCVQSICNNNHKFKLITDLIGYVSMKLLESQKTDNDQNHSIYESEDFSKVCSKYKNNQTASIYTFKSNKVLHLQNIGNKKIAFCTLRKLWYQSVLKHFNKLNNGSKFCKIRKNNRLLDLKLKLNTGLNNVSNRIKSRKHAFNKKLSSATSILPVFWSIWLCLVVSLVNIGDTKY